MLQRIVPIVLGVAVANGVSAAQWTTSAAVAPQIVYSDNVCLSSDDEQGEWWGVIKPSGSINGSGNRANVSLSGSVDVSSLTNSDLDSKGCNSGGLDRDRDQYRPRFNARADAVLVDQWLFIDADATASQNNVSPFVAGGDDAADRTGNANTTYRYSVSPYIQRRFKNNADLTIRYTYDDQYNSKDLVGDSSKQSVAAILAGGPVFSPISWSLQGNYSKVDYSDTNRPDQQLNNDTELKSAQFNLGYQVNRAWQINGYFGQEWNDFVSSRDDIDGGFWDVGFRWAPTSRTTVEGGIGDRFFGSAPRFSINHRHKRSVFSANYEKTLTYSRDIRTLGVGDGIDQPADSTTLTNSPILDERFTLTYSYNGRRSRLGINASYSDQTREGGVDRDAPTLELNESTFKRLSMSLSHPLSRKLSLTGQVSWHEQEPKGEHSGLIRKSETWRFRLEAQRPLNSNTNLSLKYVYTNRQSDNAFNEYQENRITLTVRFNLI